MSSNTTIFWLPTTVDVRELAPREAEVHEHHVLDVPLEERGAARDDVDRLHAEQMEDDREVVRREAPQRALVAPHLAEVHSLGIDVVQLAQVPPLHHPFEVA